MAKGQGRGDEPPEDPRAGGLGAELKRRRRLLRLAIPELAQRTGVNKNTLGAYERGTRTPDADFLAAFAQATGTGLQELLAIRARECPSIAHEAALRAYGDASAPGGVAAVGEGQLDYACIPAYGGTAATAGDTAAAEGLTPALAFRRAWLREVLRASPSDLMMIYVEGESMVPLLSPGEIALVDRRDTAVRHDGLYALRIDDAVVIKRLQRLPGQRIRVTSEHPGYQPFELAGDALGSEPVDVIGRVVWAGHPT